MTLPLIPGADPFYVDAKSGIVLYCADCRELLEKIPAGMVDSVVADPPYGIGWDGIQAKGDLIYRGTRKQARRFGDEARVINDDVPFDPLPLTSRFPCCFTGAQYFYDRLPAGGSIHCWNKKGEYKPMDQGDADMVWSSKRQASRVFDLVWRGLCRHTEQSEKFVHPTQKPVLLMKWMMTLVDHSPCILDPFAGSGTTLVAAKLEGRRAIGIEISEAYCEIAKRRLLQEVFPFPE